jgi:hypothetical protein
MRDALSKVQVKKILAPGVAITDDTAKVSSIIDLQGFDSCNIHLSTGTDADANATFAVLLEEGDVSNLSDAAAVADGDMVSQTRGTAAETAAGYDFADDGEVRSLGYIGSKRYVRLTVTPTGNTGDFYLSGVAVLGHAAHLPITKAAS